ncbi:MAG: TonB-dependent receptor [Saprospiraceae bacterium]|nr:TonB-dependent receptor [Saprospiraceae bacterium]
MRYLLFFLLPAIGFGQSGIIQGTVNDKFSNEAISFANVLVLGTDKGATTNLDGNYRVEGLEPGVYNVRASFVGFQEVILYEIQVYNNKPVQVDFQLEKASLDLEEVVVKASPFRKTEESPVSLRSIGVSEIRRNPGANRDISRVIQSLPGVTSTASFRNDLIIRGGAPNENRFYLDDVEVPNINHFSTQGASGGPVGLINVDFIREVDFYSGAFPANRGNALSSVFNFKQKDGRTDRLGVSAIVGASDFGATLQGPVGEKGNFILSSRRSYLQFLFKALDLPFLPIYNDFQAKLKFKLDEKSEIYFLGLGAIDNFELNLEANETEEQQYILDALPVNNQWNYTNGLVYKRYQENGYLTFVLSRNMLNNEATKYLRNDDTDPENLILNYKSQEIENKFRVEKTSRFDNYKVNFGAGYEYVKYNNSTFNRIYTSSGPETVDYFSDLDFSKYYFFGQLSRKWMEDRLTISVGLRYDGNSYSSEMSNPFQHFSPRASLAFALSNSFSINFNSGVYYQLPPYTVLGYKEDGVLVNKNLGADYIRNDQVVAGLEWNTASASKFTLEGYWKRYYNYPFLLRDSISLANLGGDFGIIGNEPATFNNDGRSYGLELLFQQRLFKGFYGIASYTLGRSEFQDSDGNYLPSSWDSRHIANLTLGKQFGKNWEIGIALRYQSALPITPFDANQSSLVSNWDRNAAGLRNFSLLNSERGDAINTVDLRIDKKWFLKNLSINLYLDIENLTGNAVGNEQLILDRDLDMDGRPIGTGTIINPDDPQDLWRYKLKTINDATGTILPTIGVVLEY